MSKTSLGYKIISEFHDHLLNLLNSKKPPILSFFFLNQLINSIIIRNSYVRSSMNSRERSSSVVECLTPDQGLRARASPASLHCVIEQDTLILA